MMSVCEVVSFVVLYCFFFFKQKTAYEMRISDWSSDVCSSDLGSLILLHDRWTSRKRAFRNSDRYGPGGCVIGTVKTEQVRRPEFSVPGIDTGQDRKSVV